MLVHLLICKSHYYLMLLCCNDYDTAALFTLCINCLILLLQQLLLEQCSILGEEANTYRNKDEVSDQRASFIFKLHVVHIMSLFCNALDWPLGGLM